MTSLNNSLSNLSISVSQPLPHSSQAASVRVGYLMEHAVQMLNHLEVQHNQIGILPEKLETIYTKAHEQIQIIHSDIERTIEKRGSEEELPLTKGKVKDLSKKLKLAEKEIAKVVLDTQMEVAIEAQASKNKGTRIEISHRIFSILENNGWGAAFIRLIALVSETHRYAVKAFDAMKTPHWQIVLSSAENKSEVDSDKVKEFIKNNGNLDRRAGVIGLDGIYHFQALFSEEKVYDQFKSFVAQNLSQRERRTIECEMTIDKINCKSVLVPLNVEFDAHLAQNEKAFNVFGKIFGTKGISSTNRQEGHLINGWESNLFHEGKRIYRALRHAITSDKYERDPKIREANSKKAAEELLKAALLQEIASQGLTLEEARKKGIQLNLNSGSLVTPDFYRQYLPGLDNEREMLNDQIGALKSFQRNEMTNFELDGVEIPVKVKVNAFNFGVNFGAVEWKMGVAYQYDLNKSALEGMRGQFNDFLNEIYEKIIPLTPELNEKINKALFLLDDINDLIKDKEAYLEGGNQYEITAKILIFTHFMDQISELANKDKTPAEKMSGFKSAFNCMSGKDRTGFLDAVAKTLALMIETNPTYPSHKKFMEEEDLRKQFINVLITMLLKFGNLDVTEINTDARGLKIHAEARLFGMEMADFLQVQGLSSTTSS